MANPPFSEFSLLVSDLLDLNGVAFTEECVGSGDAVPHDLHDRFQALFGFELPEGCGLTEAGTDDAVNPIHGRRRLLNAEA
ncbi:MULTISPECIES: hypothetical protein [unclassified Thiocapsa]|uniref:hypothetical protein n=1 Tax=unclassified Thiocapsa TaxID=2641286 RepID=UPI0035B31EC5